MLVMSKDEVQTTVYLDRETHKRLKVHLVNKGQSFAEWLREKVEKELQTPQALT